MPPLNARLRAARSRAELHHHRAAAAAEREKAPRSMTGNPVSLTAFRAFSGMSHAVLRGTLA